MSESYPHFDFESHEDKGDKPQKRDRPAGKIERPIGRMVTPLGQHVPLKPLGELYSPKAEKPVESQKPLPHASEFHVPAEFPNLRLPETGELASMAEQAQRKRIEAELREQSDGKNTQKESKQKPAYEVKESDTADKRSDALAATFNHTMMPNAPELAQATSQGQLSDVRSEHEKLGPEVEQDSQLPPETDENFHAITNQPELSDLASKHVPETPRLSVEEQTKPEAFDAWVRQSHPELAEPGMAAASNSDDGFNDIVRHNYGEGVPASPTRFHEQAPGEPPIDAGGNGANMPPYPPTAEGGAWSSPSSWERPAGGLGGPAALAGMSALEARRHLDNLRHTAAELTLAGGEAALAGAVGILGLALAAEHIRAKYRERKLDRQLHQQNAELNRTNQALAAERARQLQTREQFDSLRTSSEQQDATTERILPAAEVATGVGIASATAMSEFAPKRDEQATNQQHTSDQELANRLRHSRELGRAIQRNPEMRSAAETTSNELSELVGTSAYADSLKRERNYEHLQTEPTDNGGQIRSAGGADATGSSGTLGLPHPGVPVLPIPHNINGLASRNEKPAATSKAKPVAAATVLVVVILILIFVFR